MWYGQGKLDVRRQKYVSVPLVHYKFHVHRLIDQTQTYFKIFNDAYSDISSVISYYVL